MIQETIGNQVKYVDSFIKISRFFSYIFRVLEEFRELYNRIENSITFAVKLVIHKSFNLIGTLGSSEFGPK